jgi:hypothetical protein
VIFGINHHKGHDGHQGKALSMSAFVSLVTFVVYGVSNPRFLHRL